MILGRTPEGLIKIKKDDPLGLRAVNCACCGGCLCGSAVPINPPSDPNFTKKLTGNDPNVAPFTQVSINYSITVTTQSNLSHTASGTMNGSWVDAIVHDPEGEYRCADYIGGPYTDPSSFLEINRVFQGNNCSFDYFCLGNCGKSQDNPSRIGSVYLYLRSDGCLIAILSEDYLGGYFYISKECPDRTLANAGISISINGVSTYIVYEDPSVPSDTLNGFLNVTFS